jgi:hypothetical protein
VITSGTGPTAIDVTPTPAACNQDNGAIRINDVTGGAAPYEYSIDGGGYSGTTNYIDLSAGNHTVDVRDANGCVFSTTIVITSGTGPTAIDVNTNPVACGQDNGSLSIDGVTGGSAPYSYSVDGGTYSGSTNYPDLSAGNHTVNVRDANGCIFSTTVNITAGTGPTNVNVTTTDADCGADNGSLAIGTVTGGTGPYTYSVDNGPFSGSRNYSDLASGNHTVDVRDDNGCVYSTTVMIGSGAGPNDINVDTDNETCGNGNGAIRITSVTGGTAPYTYSVDGSTFGSTTNYTGLSSGSHSVQARDANGCLYLINVNITTSGGPIAVDVDQTDAECGIDNGTFTVTNVNGGRAPYSYSVDGGNIYFSNFLY